MSRHPSNHMASFITSLFLRLSSAHADCNFNKVSVLLAGRMKPRCARYKTGLRFESALPEPTKYSQRGVKPRSLTVRLRRRGGAILDDMDVKLFCVGGRATQFDLNDGRSRWFGGAQVRFYPLKWLTFEGRGGLQFWFTD
jgi:hypothetical protein